MIMTNRTPAHDSAAWLLCTAALLSGAVHAETIVFQATSDFPVIDAGEVPYYSEAPGRLSLAINAANENFRDKFARATTVYQGESGFFDITITSLAELDGEAVYRVLINDVLVGTATNPAVTVDYTPIRHTFEDVVVPVGSTIAVESLANTNGNIPEGNGTAFARGRWTTLELNNDDAGVGTSADVDLSVAVSLDKASLAVGDAMTLTVDVANSSDGAVATGALLTVTRPRSELGAVTIGECTEVRNDISCNLPELPAGSSEQVILTFEALEVSPQALLVSTVSADQADKSPQNNSLIVPLSINEVVDPVTPDNVTPETGNAGSESKSGGGAMGWLAAMGFLGLCYVRRSS
jgi:hypothetical protein